MLFALSLIADPLGLRRYIRAGGAVQSARAGGSVFTAY